jgi:hypothetical protein
MDFLTRLAARALNPEPAVKPCPVPLFAQEVPGGFEAFEIETEAAPRPAPVIAREPGVAPRGVPLQRDTPAQQSGSRPAAAPAPPGPRSVEPAVAARSDLEAATIKARHASSAPEPERPTVPIRAVGGVPEPVPSNAPAAVRIETVTRLERNVLEVRTERQVPFRAAPAAPGTPRRARRQPDAAPPTRERPATIEVTIGRVEVRAVTPSQTSRPEPTRRAPALSLDEYLERRNRGRS